MGEERREATELGPKISGYRRVGEISGRNTRFSILYSYRSDEPTLFTESS